MAGEPDLVAGQAGLGHLNGGRSDFENVPRWDVSLDEAGDREVLGERTGIRDVDAELLPVGVVLVGIDEDCHVRSSVVLVDVRIAGKAEHAGSHGASDRCLDEGTLLGTASDRKRSDVTDAYCANLTDELDSHVVDG